MKRLLIIVESLNVGGTTSSLINLVKCLSDDKYIVKLGLINNYEDDRKKVQNICECIDLKELKRPNFSLLKKILIFLKNKNGRLYLRNKLLKHFIKKQETNTVMLAQISDCIISEYANPVDFSSSFDLIISWCELYTNNLLAEKIFANKKIGFVHPDYIQAGFSKIIDYKYFRNLDSICAVSKEGCLSLEKTFPDLKGKISYIHNKLDVEDINKKAEENSELFNKSSFNIVTVARIQNVSKGFDRIIRCTRVLKDSGYKFLWHIIGNGEDFAQLKKNIIKNDLSDCFKLYGQKTNPYPYIKQADLFSLCSYYEGFPVVVDEAMILNVPCFVTKYAAAEEQVAKEYGFVVDNNENGIIEGLKYILDNKQELINKKLNLEKMNKDKYSDCSDFYTLIEKVVGE